MARASAGLTSAARTVVSASTVVSAATRVVFVFIVVFLVVILLDLSRNFFLDCLRNDTVNVSCVILHYAALGILSSIELWGHWVKRMEPSFCAKHSATASYNRINPSASRTAPQARSTPDAHRRMENHRRPQ